MKKSLLMRLAVSILLGAALLLAGLATVSRFSAKSKKKLETTPGMYRQSKTPGLPYEHVPGKRGMLTGVKVRFNALGFRGPEIERPKPAGLFRVVVMGDSQVFGHRLQENQTLPVLLENRLRESSPETNWEVVNAGVRGYDMVHYLPFLHEKVLALDPNFLLLVITENNDPRLSIFKPDSEKIRAWKKARWTKWTILRPIFGAMYSEEVNRLFIEHVRSLYEPDGEPWRRFEAGLSEISEVCENRGITLLAVTLPVLIEDEIFQRERVQLKEALQKKNIPYIDPEPRFEEFPISELTISPADLHCTGKANQLTAEMAAEKIIEMTKNK